MALQLIDNAGAAGATAGPRADVDIPPPHTLYYAGAPRTELKHVS